MAMRHAYAADMNEAEVIEITRQAILLTLKISGPIMMIGLVVGLVIALFQALTQIQEITLTFVPKIIAIFLAIFFFLPAMAVSLTQFMTFIADQIVAIN